ncbi:MAG: hypothetical protein AAB590_03390 [Patescibacteria group bacterium]
MLKETGSSPELDAESHLTPEKAQEFVAKIADSRLRLNQNGDFEITFDDNRVKTIPAFASLTLENHLGAEEEKGVEEVLRGILDS